MDISEYDAPFNLKKMNSYNKMKIMIIIILISKSNTGVLLHIFYIPGTFP